VRLLLDTHLIIWAAGRSSRLSKTAKTLMGDSGTELVFSAASIWEVAIKRALGNIRFQVDPRLLRRGLLDNGYSELPVSSDHGIAVSELALLHKDPFDRILIAQAMVEGITLLTADSRVAQYPGPIRLV
jgi:PIN domain nuclease of toxin-antitoxin system